MGGWGGEGKEKAGTWMTKPTISSKPPSEIRETKARCSVRNRIPDPWFPMFSRAVKYDISVLSAFSLKLHAPLIPLFLTGIQLMLHSAFGGKTEGNVHVNTQMSD